MLREDDARFPSGEWSGFYVHGFGTVPRHPVTFLLTFANGSIQGSDSADQARFSWSGTYSTWEGRCWMHMRTPTQTVYFDGRVDVTGIRGLWEIHAACRGGFHFWPGGRKGLLIPIWN